MVNIRVSINGVWENRVLRDGTTAIQAFNSVCPGSSPNTFQIKINGDAHVPANRVMREGDQMNLGDGARVWLNVTTYDREGRVLQDLSGRFNFEQDIGLGEALLLISQTLNEESYVAVETAPTFPVTGEVDEINMDYAMDADQVVFLIPKPALPNTGVGFAAVGGADTGFAPRPTIRVILVDNEGAGFANQVEVPVGSTAMDLFRQLKPGQEPTRFLIRLNGAQQVASATLLNAGDRVSITPTKVEGAARVLLVANDNSGFSDYVEVQPGTTIGQLFRQRFPSSDPSRYYIRVNGAREAESRVLNEGDRVSVTPAKVAGAKDTGFCA